MVRLIPLHRILLTALPGTLAALLVLGAGCGRKATYEGKDGKVTIDKKSGEASYEVTTKEGKMKMSTSEAGVALPDGFPKDVPIYKGAKVQMALNQGKQIMVQLMVSASQQDAGKYYQDEMKSQGWTNESAMNMPEMTMLQFKKEKRTCGVHVMKQDKGSMVQIVVEPGDN
jgi:hypothetical protein